MVNVHRQRWNALTLAHTNRTCCWPAPTTSLQSLKVISRLKRFATAPRMSATLAETSVQENARHPGRPPGRHERLVPLVRHLPVQLELARRPSTALASALGQVDAVFAVEPG